MVESNRLLRLPLVYTAMAAVLVVYLFPIYWTVLSSVKPTGELLRHDSFWPAEFTWQHYQDVLEGTRFLIFMRNSVIVALGCAVLTLLIAATAAYSLSRLEFRGRELVSRFVLLVYLFPGILLVIPTFGMLLRLNLYDTFAGLILLHVLYTMPFGVWTMKNFYDTVPPELEDAARVDGAERMTVLRKIYVPLAKPGFATVALFAFVISWNEYLFAAIMVQSDSRKTLPVGIAEWSATYSIDWGQITSASVMTLIPAVVFFAFVGRFFVHGLTSGSVRG